MALKFDFPLRPYQIEARKAWRDYVAAGRTRGMVSLPTGCHAPGQGILMYDRSIKLVENINVGDKLLGPDGTIRTVAALRYGHSGMFEIQPKTGNPWRVTYDHLLTVAIPAVVDHIASFTLVDIKTENVASLGFLTHTSVLKLVRVSAFSFYTKHFIPFAVVPVGIGEYFGFTLETSDGRYLLDDGTITHNCGKTLLSLACAVDFGRTLFLVHRDELAKQTEKSARAAVGDIEIGIVKAERDETHAKDLVIASTQTVSRTNRLSRLLASQEEFGPFKLIVHDEAHRAAAPTSLKILDAFPDIPTMGLSATPERSDNKGLAKIFGPHPIYKLKLTDAIDQGWLVPYISERIVCNTLHMENVRINPETGDYDLSDLEKEVARADLSKAVAEEIARVTKLGRKSLVFCVSVDQARRTAEYLVKIGVAAAWLSGESAESERDEVINSFSSGELRVLCNCSLFTEGTDIPSVTCIVNAAPTLSRNTYVQKVGRGLRLCPPHKEDLLILDLVGAHEVHGLITADNMTEDASPKKKGKGVPPLNINLGSRRDVEFGMVLATAEATQSGIAVKAAKKKHRTKWLCVLEERVFALSAGEHGALLMIREPGDLDMWMGYRLPSDAWAHDEAHRIMHRPAPRELTTGVVEDRARKLGVFGLSNENARWRDRDPSEKQLALFARKWPMVPVPATSGEAADWITTEKLRELFRGF